MRDCPSHHRTKFADQRCVYESKWSLSLDPARSKRKFLWAKPGDGASNKKFIDRNQTSFDPTLQKESSNESEPSAGTNSCRRKGLTEITENVLQKKTLFAGLC